jgi:hypothetical protein
MSLVRALRCCACGSVGVLLVAGASVPSAETATGANGADSAATNPATAAPAEASSGEAGSGETSPGEENPADSADACAADPVCVDDYLWSLYEQTPKLDAVKEPQQTKVKVKRKGKAATVTKTVTKVVGEDFAWKDPKAAGVAGMGVKDYVIGGMDAGFRMTLYRALRVLDDAGLKPGITCAFRDDYRQSIATGLKAQNDRSYHGGSFRGGYGHGLAADIVSVRGETRMERLESTGQMWDYINKHENELGIGRPYLDRDPPHVAPIDGQEYADHRLRPKMQPAAAAARKNQAQNQAQNQANGQAKNQAKHQAKDQAKHQTKNQANSQARKQAQNQTRKQAQHQARNNDGNRDRDRLPAAYNDHGTPMRIQVARPPSKAQAKARMHSI